jgi:glutathione S-transferase
MRLWQIPFSTNVERVALALARKGLDAEPVVVEPSDRSRVRALSGQDLVPVLETADGEVLAGSLRIVAHLEERHPHAPLWPEDPARRAEADLFCDWFDRVWKRPPNRIADAILAGREPEAAWWEELRGSLDRFAKLLTNRPYLLGDSLAVADVAAFPFLKYASLLDPADDEVFHRVLGQGLELMERHEQVRAWIQRVNRFPRSGVPA